MNLTKVNDSLCVFQYQTTRRPVTVSQVSPAHGADRGERGSETFCATRGKLDLVVLIICLFDAN